MKKINKTPKTIITVFGLVFLLLIISKVYKNIPVNAEKNYKTEIYYVSSGQTLWSIGKGYTKNTDDIREWIFEVNKINNINGDIYAGQKIRVEDWRE
jgi:LysM repeat protein